MNVQIEHVLTPTTLFRLGNREGQGLWYGADGMQTGLVHKHGIAAAALPMGRHPIFSDGGFSWISVTNSLDTLAQWFSVAEMERLAPLGYMVEVVEASYHRTLTFSDYGYAHQVYRIEHCTSFHALHPMDVYREPAE